MTKTQSQIVKLYKEGKSKLSISKTLKVSRTYVYSVLKKFNLI